MASREGASREGASKLGAAKEGGDSDGGAVDGRGASVGGRLCRGCRVWTCKRVKPFFSLKP
ncbi:hypothetical protein GCM10017620_03140 [Brevundimonas intermedia]|uniref:Uncharacterized protein n=1 Tax=Brevundimonas intermedia TaxID=74315 RepID=A0ABQ5T4P7_9CAUL|nr:hypothetical protein GCM10017620_03140 [Brevundimonas intermedia]